MRGLVGLCHSNLSNSCVHRVQQRPSKVQQLRQVVGATLHQAECWWNCRSTNPSGISLFVVVII